MNDRQGVIFDVDGVLIDSYQSHFQSWCELASEMGRTYTATDFAKGFGRTSRDIIVEQWSDRTWTADEVRRLDDRKEWLYREIIRHKFPAMPGAGELIRALHSSGFATAVGSSGPPENVDLVMEKLGVSEIMACRITARQVTRGKPDPQAFQLAAGRLELAPESCCVIEDAPVGIQAAHSAGIVCVGLASTGRTRAELQAAECVVDSLDELTPQRISDLIRRGLRLID